MAFIKAMPKAFGVTLFNGRCDYDKVKNIYRQVSVAQLLTKQLCVVSIVLREHC